jgi:hypothetical protein
LRGGHGDLPRVLRYLCTGIEPPRPGDPPGAPPRVRPPHDYGVAVILVGIADRMVPPDQVEPLRRGIVTFLTASQLDLIDNSFQLIADQIVTMQSPQQLSGQLDELLDGVESIRQTAIDTDRILGSMGIGTSA